VSLVVLNGIARIFSPAKKPIPEKTLRQKNEHSNHVILVLGVMGYYYSLSTEKRRFYSKPLAAKMPR
jgi:hypothetical protein